MGQDQSSVFDLAAVAAASNGGNNDPLLPPARYIGAPQKPSKMPYNKYVAYDKQVPFDFPERTWPGKRLQRAPRWCSVDLRDGNQALVNPMDSERKLRFWNLLVSMGFKEIEVGFPSASETDYDFIRMLIERELIPDDVTIVVLTQAREHLIRKTYECLKGAKRAVVHFYNSVSVLQREVVFRKNKEEIKKIATDGAKLVRQLSQEYEGNFLFEYSPVQGARGRSQGHRPVLRVFSGILHRHRAGVCSRGVQRGDRRHQADAGTSDDHQPAGNRGNDHAERLRRRGRVCVQPPRTA